MQYRGLPVLQGDAHLLVSDRGAYLVDGGSCGTGFVSMLKTRGVKKLRAAVITHFDPDHVEGILELLRVGFPMTECWVPATLASTCRAAVGLRCDMDEWRTAVSSSLSFPSEVHVSSGTNDSAIRPMLATGGRILSRLALDCCLGHAPYAALGAAEMEDMRRALWGDWCDVDADSGESLRRIMTRLAFGGDESAEGAEAGRAVSWHRFSACVAGRLCERCDVASHESRLGTTLSLLSRAAILLSEFPGRIRFFSNCNDMGEHLVPHSHMMCLNGEEVLPPAVTSRVGAEELVSIALNASDDRNCAVFRYGDANGAVLFCSDSSLPFLGTASSLVLDRPTVVTAPRHGSRSCDRVYPLIKAEDPKEHVWVRSYVAGQRKCSEWFMNMPRSFCVNCLGQLMQEVVVKHDGREWLALSGNAC